MKPLILLLMATVLAAPVLASAQDAQLSKPRAYKGALTASGIPDLKGIWTNASLTRLERDPTFGSGLVMTPDEVRRLEGDRKALVAEQAAPTDPNASLSQVNGSCEVKGYTGGPACGYNGAWTDPGDVVMRVAGQPRTSFITYPADGHMPPRVAGAPDPGPRRGGGEGSREGDRPGQNDNPEGRSLGERCIMSFGQSSGPVMQPQLYNNNYEIVQSKDSVAIWVEMVHDVKIVRLNTPHRTDGVRPWMGDSVGHYEGPTLVVETTNFPKAQALQGSWQTLKVTERFTRVAADRVLYQFKVEDPTVWTQPWGGEYEFGSAKGLVYEYACHEGNYGLEGILAGARDEERTAGEAAQKRAAGGR
jgi:hypothetical protein